MKDDLTGEQRLIDADGNCGYLCWSPDGDRFVFSTGKTVYIYDVAKGSVTGNLGRGEYPQWAPDGKWISFENRGRLWLVSPDGKTRKRLFKTGKIYSAILWSPDSRFVSYTQSGGSSGGFLFWGIKCIEPYRVWVYRVEDGAKDWVLNICKPSRTFHWIRNEEISPD